MKEKTFLTPKGTIHYWTNEILPERETLVFLPGLTADHRLFDLQVSVFEDQCNVLVWDAPGHAASRPFELDFSLKDKAVWLHEILVEEGIEKPILVGQSMGGYVSQAYIQKFPGSVKYFISIDSAPLQRKYYTAIEIWLLKHTETMYRMYPWEALKRDGAKGCAETEYGQSMMRKMMMEYDDDPKYYCRLTSHGYKMLAQAVELNLPYRIDCPVLLICGDKDKAGSAKRYNLRWAEMEAYRLEIIPGAGHNSNTDCPEIINSLISSILK